VSNFSPEGYKLLVVAKSKILNVATEMYFIAGNYFTTKFLYFKYVHQQYRVSLFYNWQRLAIHTSEVRLAAMLELIRYYVTTTYNALIFLPRIMKPIKLVKSYYRPNTLRYCALGYGLDDGFEPHQGIGNVLFTTASRPVLGPTHPPIQLMPRTLYLGVKRPGREADHSPPSSAEVKNTWSYISTPPICLHGVVLS
jgi:hypothetical protein